MSPRPITGRSARVALLAAAALLLAVPAARAGGPKSSPPGNGASTSTHGQPSKPAHPAHGPQTAAGVVQSVSPAAVTLKQLDGTLVSVPIDRHTVIFVNARRARLAAVQPGFVLDAHWIAGKVAQVLHFLRPG
jgi:hypothetical protein